MGNGELGVRAIYANLPAGSKPQYTWTKNNTRIDVPADTTTVTAPDAKTARWAVHISAENERGETTLTLTLDIAKASHPLNVDTGQDRCFDETQTLARCPGAGAPFFGQDAQYGPVTKLKDFAMKNDVVVDRRTGLVWLDPAQDDLACEPFEALGRSDWRLPTLLDWFTLLDLGAPGLPTDFTDRRTKMRTDEDKVDVADGLQTFGRGIPIRCVRGGNFDTIGEIAYTNSRTITHFSTGRDWTASNNPALLSWRDALAYCENLTHESRSDWRLPNFFELASIAPHFDLFQLSYESQDPPLDVYGLHFWTSTTVRGIENWAYGIKRHFPALHGYGKTGLGHALCVRTAD